MDHPLITQLSATTRKILAKCRALAMQGQLQVAIDNLEEARNHILSPSSDYQVEIECVALSLLKVELLHLELRDEDAFSILQSEVLSKIEVLPYELTLVINQNKSEIEISLLTPESGQGLNRSYDERELVGVKFWNPEAIVYAFEYAAEGKHYESLPAFWQELESTYKNGSWLAHRQAAGRMAIELIQLGEAHLAAYQAVISQDGSLIEEIGKQLLLWRDSERIRLTIQKILTAANLKRHAYIASVFFKVIADAIPEDQLNAIFDWLLERAKLTPQNWRDLALMRSIWETLFEVIQRLTTEQGETVVETAVNHEMWTSSNRLREDLLKAVNAAVPHLPKEKLVEIANKALPAATNEKEQVDYAEALNLVCHIAERSEEAKKIIGDSLYSQPSFESFELQILAPLFNKGMLAEDAERMALEIAKDIRLQVQRYKEGDNVSRPMMIIASLSRQGGDENIIVHMYVFTPLDGLLKHRKMLSQSAIEKLINAILDMIYEPDNIPANKVGLLSRISKTADCLTPKLAEMLFEKLSPLVEGKKLQSSNIMQGFGNPDSPLNPYKLDVQKPEDVQASALLTLAKIEENQPGIYGNRLISLLEKSMTDPHPIIRKHAFVSVRKINVLGEVAITNLLMGTRDPDAIIAAQAYLALAENEHLLFSEAEWLSLAHSLTLAFNSPNSVVRRNAAYVIAKRQSQWQQTSIAEKMNELKTAFANDICYSVRATALQNASKNEN